MISSSRFDEITTLIKAVIEETFKILTYGLIIVYEFMFICIVSVSY